MTRLERLIKKLKDEARRKPFDSRNQDLLELAQILEEDYNPIITYPADVGNSTVSPKEKP